MSWKKCKQCKKISTAEEMAVHVAHTHGVSFDMQRFASDRFGYIVNVDEELLEKLWEEQKGKGKKKYG